LCDNAKVAKLFFLIDIFSVLGRRVGGPFSVGPNKTVFWQTLC